jgi:hypothetical protein
MEGECYLMAHHARSSILFSQTLPQNPNIPPVRAPVRQHQPSHPSSPTPSTPASQIYTTAVSNIIALICGVAPVALPHGPLLGSLHPTACGSTGLLRGCGPMTLSGVVMKTPRVRTLPGCPLQHQPHGQCKNRNVGLTLPTAN